MEISLTVVLTPCPNPMAWGVEVWRGRERPENHSEPQRGAQHSQEETLALQGQPQPIIPEGLPVKEGYRYICSANVK